MPSRAKSFAERALVILTAGGLLVLPFIFTGGVDYFRTVKEAAMRTQALLSVFALAVAVAYGGNARLRELLRDRVVVAILGAMVLWAAVTTLTSQYRLLSIDSFVSVVCAALLFLCVWYIAPDVPITALLVLVPAVAINAMLVSFQETRVWNPFQSGIVRHIHLAASGFIGNPNEVGAYLALCFIVLFVMAESLHGKLRLICAGSTIVALSGVLISVARTAMLATGASLVVMAARRSYKTAIVIVLAVALALFAATRYEIPGLTRLTQLPVHISAGHWDLVFSDRLPAFLAAVEMFRDHPIVGIGPGTYKFFYLPYRIELDRTYPAAILQAAGANFSETHNDHLQVLAESGIPGYVLMIAACGVLLIRSFRKNSVDADIRARFASRVTLPFVVAFLVLALAFFPLHTAVTRHLLVTMAALITGWSRP